MTGVNVLVALVYFPETVRRLSQPLESRFHPSLLTFITTSMGSYRAESRFKVDSSSCNQLLQADEVAYLEKRRRNATIPPLNPSTSKAFRFANADVASAYQTLLVILFNDRYSMYE